MSASKIVTAAAHCMRCDYLLTGASPRCPECGVPYSLDDAATCYRGRRITALERRLVAPPGWILHLAALLAFVGILDYVSLPGEFIWRSWYEDDEGLLRTLHLMPVTAAGVWLARLLACAGLRIILRNAPRLTARDVARWLVLPACLLAAITVALLCDTRLIRFHLSKPFMEAFAKNYLAQPPGAPLPSDCWIGLYPARGLHRAYNGFSFNLPAGGFCCAVEMAYSTGEGLAESTSGHEFHWLGGDWYVTGWDW